jgi:hypothetical protein
MPYLVVDRPTTDDDANVFPLRCWGIIDVKTYAGVWLVLGGWEDLANVRAFIYLNNGPWEDKA